MTKPCKECKEELHTRSEPTYWRPAPYPGPRCYTHWLAERRRRKEAAHEKRVQKVYGLEEGEYGRLYERQGGRCGICRRATGASKRLAVDHDHQTGDARGLLCSVCNSVLAHARDDATFFFRAAAYLKYPPAMELRDET